MRTNRSLMLCALAGAFALSAQAADVRAADVPRITNGGTGFIGLTESAAGVRSTGGRMDMAAAATSGIPTQAGEASTLVNGRPNQHPRAAGTGMDSTQAMGAGAAPPMERGSRMAPRSVATHPASGTPD